MSTLIEGVSELLFVMCERHIFKVLHEEVHLSPCVSHCLTSVRHIRSKLGSYLLHTAARKFRRQSKDQ